jgi:parvulin-like peptidyl-prolyl isomerase
MTAKFPRAFALLLFALPTVAALAASAPPGDVVAQAGSTELTSADVRALVAALPAEQRAQVAGNTEALEQVVRAELVRRAVIAEAKAKGFDRQADTQAQLERVRDEALMRLWVASKSAVPAGYPTENDVQKAYDENRQALTAPTEYRVAQIFIAAPNGGDPAKLAAALRKAADVAAKLPGADFGKLAEQQSEHAESASRGGDLGYLAESRMLPEIAAAVRNLRPGETVGPVKTAAGLHFLKLVDRKAGAVPALPQARDDLVRILRARRAQELQNTYLQGLNTQLNVSVNQIALAKLAPFLK